MHLQPPKGKYVHRQQQAGEEFAGQRLRTVTGVEIGSAPGAVGAESRTSRPDLSSGHTSSYKNGQKFSFCEVKRKLSPCTKRFRPLLQRRVLIPLVTLLVASIVLGLYVGLKMTQNVLATLDRRNAAAANRTDVAGNQTVVTGPDKRNAIPRTMENSQVAPTQLSYSSTVHPTTPPAQVQYGQEDSYTGRSSLQNQQGQPISASHITLQTPPLYAAHFNNLIVPQQASDQYGSSRPNHLLSQDHDWLGEDRSRYDGFTQKSILPTSSPFETGGPSIESSRNWPPSLYGAQAIDPTLLSDVRPSPPTETLPSRNANPYGMQETAFGLRPDILNSDLKHESSSQNLDSRYQYNINVGHSEPTQVETDSRSLIHTGNSYPFVSESEFLKSNPDPMIDTYDMNKIFSNPNFGSELITNNVEPYPAYGNYAFQVAGQEKQGLSDKSAENGLQNNFQYDIGFSRNKFMEGYTGMTDRNSFFAGPLDTPHSSSAAATFSNVPSYETVYTNAFQNFGQTRLGGLPSEEGMTIKTGSDGSIENNFAPRSLALTESARSAPNDQARITPGMNLTRTSDRKIATSFDQTSEKVSNAQSQTESNSKNPISNVDDKTDSTSEPVLKSSSRKAGKVLGLKKPASDLSGIKKHASTKPSSPKLDKRNASAKPSTGKFDKSSSKETSSDKISRSKDSNSPSTSNSDKERTESYQAQSSHDSETESSESVTSDENQDSASNEPSTSDSVQGPTHRDQKVPSEDSDMNSIEIIPNENQDSVQTKSSPNEEVEALSEPPTPTGKSGPASKDERSFRNKVTKNTIWRSKNLKSRKIKVNSKKGMKTNLPSTRLQHRGDKPRWTESYEGIIDPVQTHGKRSFIQKSKSLHPMRTSLLLDTDDKRGYSGSGAEYTETQGKTDLSRSNGGRRVVSSDLQTSQPSASSSNLADSSNLTDDVLNESSGQGESQGSDERELSLQSRTPGSKDRKEPIGYLSAASRPSPTIQFSPRQRGEDRLAMPRNREMDKVLPSATSRYRTSKKDKKPGYSIRERKTHVQTQENQDVLDRTSGFDEEDYPSAPLSLESLTDPDIKIIDADLESTRDKNLPPVGCQVLKRVPQKTSINFKKSNGFPPKRIYNVCSSGKHRCSVFTVDEGYVLLLHKNTPSSSKYLLKCEDGPLSDFHMIFKNSRSVLPTVAVNCKTLHSFVPSSDVTLHEAKGLKMKRNGYEMRICILNRHPRCQTKIIITSRYLGFAETKYSKNIISCSRKLDLRDYMSSLKRGRHPIDELEQQDLVDHQSPDGDTVEGLPASQIQNNTSYSKPFLNETLIQHENKTMIGENSTVISGSEFKFSSNDVSLENLISRLVLRTLTHLNDAKIVQSLPQENERDRHEDLKNIAEVLKNVNSTIQTGLHNSMNGEVFDRILQRINDVNKKIDIIRQDLNDTGINSINHHRNQLDVSPISADGASAKENVRIGQHNKRSFHVLCFGDSLTAGYYNHGKNFFPYSIRLLQHLTEALPYPTIIENKGLSGEKAHIEMTDRLSMVLGNSTAFDLVIILGGTNDILAVKNNADDTLFLEQLKNLWVPRIVKDVQRLHQTAWATGATTLLLTIPANNLETQVRYAGLKSMREKINDGLEKFALENRTRTIFCDLARKLPPIPTQPVSNSYWDDNVHLTHDGYTLMGDIIFGCIKDKLPKAT